MNVQPVRRGQKVGHLEMLEETSPTFLGNAQTNFGIFFEVAINLLNLRFP